jgi:hypothetical protein
MKRATNCRKLSALDEESDDDLQLPDLMVQFAVLSRQCTDICLYVSKSFSQGGLALASIFTHADSLPAVTMLPYTTRHDSGFQWVRSLLLLMMGHAIFITMIARLHLRTRDTRFSCWQPFFCPFGTRSVAWTLHTGHRHITYEDAHVHGTCEYRCRFSTGAVNLSCRETAPVQVP